MTEIVHIHGDRFGSLYSSPVAYQIVEVWTPDDIRKRNMLGMAEEMERLGLEKLVLTNPNYPIERERLTNKCLAYRQGDKVAWSMEQFEQQGLNDA